MIRFMDAQWIKSQLKRLGKTQAQLATHLALAPARITEILKGERKVSLAEAVEMADFLEISFDDLAMKLGHTIERPAAGKIPVVGKVGAGEEILSIDDFPLGEGLREIDAPPGLENGCAVMVVGNSMFPRYRDGDYIVYNRTLGLDLENCYGRECVVALSDGRRLLKIVEASKRRGCVTLFSINTSFSPIPDAEIEWAAPVEWVKPGVALKRN